MLEEQDIVLGSPQSPRWSYALTKVLDEQLALSYHHQHRLPAVLVRLFNVIGPRQVGEYGMVVPRFASWSQTGWPLRIYGDGIQRRTFCDVRDVVDAMVRLLADSAHHGQLFNLGRDEKVTIRKLADLVIELSQADVTTCHMPYEQAYDRPDDDPVRRVPDLECICQAIGFEPHYSLRNALVQLIDSFCRESVRTPVTVVDPQGSLR